MYRRPKFLDALLDIRREMSHEADHDVTTYVTLVRSEQDDEPVTATASESGVHHAAECAGSVLESTGPAIS